MGRLRRIRGVVWEWREHAPEQAKEQPGMGVIAQEVQAVFPDLIEPDESGSHLTVEYDGLVPPLMAAVKELNGRLGALEERSAEMGDEESGDRSGKQEATELVSRAAGEGVRTTLDPDEIEKLFPQLVTVDEEGERVVVYEGLVGLLIESVKELDSRVAALEAPPER